ncbi:MAG: metallophosphoesterase [Chloroflexota bacterium]
MLSVPAPPTVQQIRPAPAPLVRRREPLVRRVPLTRLRLRRRRSLDPARLYYNRTWIAATSVGAAAGALGVRRLGWPLLAVAGLLGALTWGYAAFVEPRRARLEHVELRLPRLPRGLDGLRIGHLTDLHLGFRYTERNALWGVEQMRREAPDLIVITGDLVSFQHAIPDIAAALRGISAPLGVYAVPGNHDHWEGVDDVRAALAVCGVTMLINEHRRIRRGGADLWLLGVDDLWDGSASLSATLRGVPAGAFTLLLAHAPDFVTEAAARGVDVQLSGHTHGGHLRLPLLGPLGMPRFGRRYVMGRYQVGPTALYVSRGLGGPPLRLLCPPEATIITLRRG